VNPLFRLFREAVAPVAVLAALLAAVPAAATAKVELGARIDDVKLEAIGGGRQALFDRRDVTVLVFFRPGQDNSEETLKELAACEKTLAAKPVRVVALVSSSFPREEVQAFVKGTGLSAPVLVDEGDALYGALEVRQHPIALVVDRERKVAAVQPYTRLRYCEVLVARVQFLLKEITAEQLAATLEPPKAIMPSDDKAAVAKRNVNLAERYLAKGNCVLAVQKFDEALALDPANAQAAEGKKKCEATAAGAK
jgi:hypothetical protein